MLNSIIGLSGEHRFGLTVRSKDHLVPCAGLEWSKVSVQGKNVRIGQVYRDIFPPTFSWLSEICKSLISQARNDNFNSTSGYFSEFANTVYLLKTLSCFGI